MQPFIQGLILLGAVSLGALRVLRAPNRLEFLGGRPMTRALRSCRLARLSSPSASSSFCSILGGIYNRQFLSGLYLLQQLRVASFLGIIASGLMVVILLGHIDLSIPWVVTIGGITATAVAGWWGASWTALGVPLAIACGALVGLANGLGVAFLRIPSMVFTLGMNAVVQGMVVMYTGGNAPPDQATPILQWLAVRDTFHRATRRRSSGRWSACSSSWRCIGRRSAATSMPSATASGSPICPASARAQF